jgi:hypothetical protein
VCVCVFFITVDEGNGRRGGCNVGVVMEIIHRA